MRRITFAVILAILVVTACFFATGCTEKKSSGTDSTMTAKPSDTLATDTMETLISEVPMPKAADELFDDFLFNFAANRKLQFRRIKFPLLVDRFGKKQAIDATKWKMEHFFMKQDFYTLIFDNVRQMNLVKDTTVSHVVVEKIYLNRDYVKQYVFDRDDGKWMLDRVVFNRMHENNNSSFLKFYQAFVADTAFQMKSIHDPLEFTGPSPDNEFTNIDGILAPEQWPSFAPELPGGLIYNILYGQKYAESNKKIFVVRGISNGLEMQLTFKRIKSNWKLLKLIM